MPTFDINSPDKVHSTLADLVKIKSSLNALRQCENGPIEPSNMVAGMWWFDTAANILKLRNKLNTAWQNVWDFANNRLYPNVLAPGELTADTTGRAKMADLFITDAKINDVASSKLTGTVTPSDNTVSTPKLQDGAVSGAKLGHNIVASGLHQIAPAGTWVLPAGFYNLFITMSYSFSSFSIQIYADSQWNSQTHSSDWLGCLLSDGVDTRIQSYGESGTNVFFQQY